METLIKVSSSMVHSLGYDEDKEELEVIFNTGKIWIYQDVPQKIYQELVHSNSVGSFMLNNIIDYYHEERVN